MSGSPNCGSSPRWPQTARTVCSSPAISVNGFSNSRSHGGLSASMCAAGPIRCGSTTEPRTRSAFRPIGCCRQLWPMWMAMPRTGAAPCRCSTGRPRRSRPAMIRSRRPKPSAHGFQPGSETGLQPHEIGVFVRSSRELPRARSAVKQAGIQAVELSDKIEVTPGKLSIGTMHLAKGLEFRAVAVMACDDEVIPSQERIENVADDADLEEVYDSERHLLYVACTRARDHLLVTGAEPGSEFLNRSLLNRALSCLDWPRGLYENVSGTCSVVSDVVPASLFPAGSLPRPAAGKRSSLPRRANQLQAVDSDRPYLRRTKIFPLFPCRQGKSRRTLDRPNPPRTSISHWR